MKAASIVLSYNRRLIGFLEQVTSLFNNIDIK